jgi:hypothetical protein
VLSVDRDARSFRLRDAERGTFTVFVVRSTRFERTSFARLRAGVEATIRRVDGRWRASEVESGRGGHGGGDRGGDDRGRGRGTDDTRPDDSR